ncbi:xylose isomerase-like protein [Dothidotthia symphoricarpi CBS 119687]|uniref:Xylose isomerase-like protein n=1 Tax=Dothidotthia symphoricarpi CBS 119687 TaxID=1392245 RepID=A0A6A6AS09_9PLEO|nr:xylose isomerase-like protein [Dothidotthia symphoricarpi CBS 119687]KAF2134336.1 xylose isomerase-like protein [Dothidotthia symphoricarpi CBS 119687]
MAALDPASLAAVPISYASCSLGSPSDPPPLLDRLHAIHVGSFSAIELSFPDILSYGATLLGHDVEEDNYDELCTVAADIKKQCDERSLGIMMLQPFSNFEGWPEGSDGRKDAFERARGWIRIMQACGTDMLQVGSSDTPLEKLDKSRIVPDLRELSDLLKEHNFKLAYENWCWSTHAPDWKDVWTIVKEVDRPNIGLCLDTFQTAGGEWADPKTASGLLEDVSKDELTKRFTQSLEQLSTTIPKDKIYLLQISDAYKVPQPFSAERDDSGLLPRGRWSHDFRPLPYNGGYLPVADVAAAVLKTGFRGWFSYEVFDGGAEGKGQGLDIVAYARAAKSVQTRLLLECAGQKLDEGLATR